MAKDQKIGSEMPSDEEKGKNEEALGPSAAENNSQASRETLTEVKASGLILRLVQGMLIGLGAVLPGVSGGVLCVVFGIYSALMQVLADPIRGIKKQFKWLIPVLIGFAIGFMGIAKLLEFLLEKYPDPSVCVFIGLIAGMMPSLFREAGERGRALTSYVALAVSSVAVFAILIVLQIISLEIRPNFGWFIFCGFCLAISIIAPGMSFSTLLMPLGLYSPFVGGIGRLDFSIIVPAGIAAIVTIALFAKTVERLTERHYSVMFHAIFGVVFASTVMIVPIGGFTSGVIPFLVNSAALIFGVVAALLLDRFNSRYDKD